MRPSVRGAMSVALILAALVVWLVVCLEALGVQLAG